MKILILAGMSGTRLWLFSRKNFPKQYERGSGNYTEERKKIFDKKSLEEIVKEIKKR